MTGISRSTLLENLTLKQAEVDGIADDFKTDAQGRIDISGKQYRDYRAAANEVKELKGLIDDIDNVAQVREYLEAPTNIPEASRNLNGPEVKSLGDVFIDSEAYRNFAKSGRDYTGGTLRAEVEGKSIFSISGGQTAPINGLGSSQHLGISEAPRRKMHVRDLFSKASTKAATLYGVREVGFTTSFDNKANWVAEQIAGVPGKAPTSNLSFVTEMYPVAEIAHILHAHKNILSDEPRLKQYINTRMLAGVRFKEDQELLFGTGGADKVKGIANTTGVQAFTGLAKDKYSIQVRRAMTKALLAEYDPSGIVVSPEDWEDLEIETDDNGAFRVALQVAIGAEKRLWHLKVIETTAMSKGKFLLGSFDLGAQLYDRESVSVQVSNENGTNFEDGMVTVRAGERVALEVSRPESFVMGTLTPYVAPVVP